MLKNLDLEDLRMESTRLDASKTELARFSINSSFERVKGSKFSCVVRTTSRSDIVTNGCSELNCLSDFRGEGSLKVIYKLFKGPLIQSNRLAEPIFGHFLCCLLKTTESIPQLLPQLKQEGLFAVF